MPPALCFPTIDRVLCFTLLCCSLWIGLVNAGCWYNGGSYAEGEEVSTAEPCLNCTCSRSTLVCYLRVCPKLPNPPPPGCILLYRYKTCCPDLICQDSHSMGYDVRRRSEDDGLEIEENEDRSFMEDACIVNGTIYAPGSAMDSSTLCEYCYCLGGKQRCVKPKCLLPIDGCTPMYHTTSCCPIHYKCKDAEPTTSTTTLAPQILKDSCFVAGIYHPNGHKILGIGHSACDNCYCIKGLVRCEPLLCAPPILGCSPVIKDGQCCAASYNCSGNIEARPEANYGNFPIFSKQYSKFRKESIKSQFVNAATAKPHRTAGHFGTTRHFSGNIVDSSTFKPYNMMKEDPVISAKATTEAHPEIVYRPNHKYNKIDKPQDQNDVPKNKPIHINSILNGNFQIESIDNYDYSLEGRIIRRMENQSKEDTTTDSITEDTTIFETTEYIGDLTTDQKQTASTEISDVDMFASTIFELFTQEFLSDDLKREDEEYDTTTELTSTSEGLTEEGNSIPTTSKTILNSTDCIVSNSTSNETIISKNKEVTTVDLESKVQVSTVTVHPMNGDLSIAALIFAKDKEDYDYGKPTLPPSLPNLKIIPFLASDAVDTKQEEKLIYPIFESRTDNVYSYLPNSFTPPNKTESGFVPKDPVPPIEDFYDSYPSSGLDANAVTPLTTLPITPQAETNGVSCLHELTEYRHGESIPTKNICEECLCYFGNVICQEYNCPPVKPGCRKSGILERTTCCPHVICDDEGIPSPILDHLDSTPTPKDVTVAEGIVVSQNPFKDVIRTEAAPNLEILRDDMTNFIRRKAQTTTLTPKLTSTTTEDNEYEFSLEKMFQSLLDKPEVTTHEPLLPTPMKIEKTTIKAEITEKPIKIENHDNDIKPKDSPSVGLLKLAGCNIYGRMYRVGRIISELSGPCLECKCTEVGVQCKDLC